MNKRTKILREENNELDEQIKEENQEVFTDMICYLRGANISDYDIETVRHDLTEMVLSAQARGENIETVIGRDYKEFCDEIIANFSKKTVGQIVKDYIDTICLSLSVLFIINIAISKDTFTIMQNLVTGKKMNFDLSVTTGNLLTIVLILFLANMIVTLMMKNALGSEKKHQKIAGFVFGGAFMAVLIAMECLGHGTLFVINIFVALLIAAVLYGVHHILNTVG